MTIDLKETKYEGDQEVEMTVEGISIRLRVLFIRTVIEEIDVVLGMDAITKLGEVKFVAGQVRVGVIRDSSTEKRGRSRQRPEIDVGMTMRAMKGSVAAKLGLDEKVAPCTIEEKASGRNLMAKSGR